MAKSTFKTFFLTLVLLFQTKAYSMTNIFVISDKTYLGDRANLLGIAEKTKSQILNSSIQEYSVDDLTQASSKIEAERDRAIVISAGKYGIDAIKRLKAMYGDHIFAIHVFHQMIKEEKFSHSDLLDKADIIALPSHALNKDFKSELANSKTNLIETIGVAHNSKKEDLVNAYDEYKELLPKAEKYMGIILPGDAPDSNGKMKYYTPEMAAMLAQQISGLAKEKNYVILITNGPRTGKHNPNTGEVLINHQDGIIDDVTLKFIEKLKSYNIEFKLFDFQRGQQNHKNLIFGAILKNPGSIILAPGESTSMISECTDLMEAGSVIIYMNEAMNENHKKHVLSEFEDKRAHIMEDGNIRETQISDTKSPSARDIVAKAIIKEIKK